MLALHRLHIRMRVLCARDIVRSSLRIALVVGTVLNLINQGGHWLHNDGIQLGHFLLNYLVPYSVASYSAVRTRLQDIEAAERPCEPCE